MDTIKEAHYNLGIAYLEAGQYNRAVPEFEAAIKLDPNFISAHCALCRAYLEQNALESAESAITTALKLDASHQPALLLYGTVTEAYRNRGKAYLDDKSYTEAVAAFQKAITLDAANDNAEASDSEQTHVYVHLGAAYIGLKAYQEAIEALQHVIAQDADLVDAHYNLGYAYVEQDAYDEAIPHLERAIAIAPHLKRAHYNLARAYRASGNLEAATNAITETLRLDANYQPAHELADTIKQAHYNSGITHLNNERYSAAVTAFQNAITLDADFVSSHYNLGLAYLKLETYPRAISSLEKTIALDPNHKAAHHALALAYLGQQELGKARDAASAALEIDANYQPALSLLEAIDPSYTPLPIPSVSETQDPTPSASEHPVDPQPDTKSRQEMHYELGAAYLDSQMSAEAIAEFQKAIDIDPGFLPAYVSLGTTYLEMGQLDDAETAATAALEIDANSEPARQLLEDIQQARPVPPEPEPTEPMPTPTDPPDTKQDLERGLVFLNSRQYDQAAAAFKRVIKVEVDSVEAHYGLGQAYLEVGAFDDAAAAADAVLRLNPNHNQARELIQVIKFARNIERNQKIRKKVLSYAAILGILTVCVFAAVRSDIISCNGPLSPELSMVVSLEEPSKNGFLDAGETVRLRLAISNKGGTARNIRIKFDPVFITGVSYKQPDLISKLGENSTKNVAVEMTVSERVRTRTQSLKILLFLVENDGTLIASKDFPLKIRGERRQ